MLLSKTSVTSPQFPFVPHSDKGKIVDLRILSSEEKTQGQGPQYNNGKRERIWNQSELGQNPGCTTYKDKSFNLTLMSVNHLIFKMHLVTPTAEFLQIY